MKYLKVREEKHDDNNDENETELAMLLSKFDIRSLLTTHDELAGKFNAIKSEQQKLNREIMMEHQQIKKLQLEAKKFGSLENLIETVGLNNLMEQEESSSCDHDELESKVEVVESCSNGSKVGDNLLSEEGKFLLNKAQHYAVDNLKLVNIEKMDAPLGATIRNRDGFIVISRIVVGGAAQQSGLLHEDDEILEINNIPVRGKTINDICDMLVSKLPLT
jgi:hypothetical protein